MSLERIGVVGSGNVGSGLVMELSRSGFDGQVEVCSRDENRALAAIADASSAFPEGAKGFVAKEFLNGEYDLIVVTAGLLPSSNMSGEELLAANIEIAVSSLSDIVAKTVVVIGTPVDRLTEELAGLPEFKETRMIGFGGELDRARIRTSLISRAIEFEQVYAVGEHGPRTIPVYDGEKDFQDVAGDATTVLKGIMASTPAPRNMATGVQLMRLIDSLNGKAAVHCISTVDEDFDSLSITWPREVSGESIIKQDITVGDQAKNALEQLLDKRRQERGKNS